jgi:hypothetical protein
MSLKFLVIVGLCSILFSQIPQSATVHNLTHTLSVVSCQKAPSDTSYDLTVTNTSTQPIGFITVSGYTGGTQTVDFLDSLRPSGTAGLAPGDTWRMRVSTSYGKPDTGVTLLATIGMDGQGDGDPKEIASAIAAWIGASIQYQKLVELTKILTVDSSDQTVDRVLANVEALDSKLPPSTDPRMAELLRPLSGVARDEVEVHFYAGLNQAKNNALDRLNMMKTNMTGSKRQDFASGVSSLYDTKASRLNQALARIGGSPQ